MEVNKEFNGYCKIWVWLPLSVLKYGGHGE